MSALTRGASVTLPRTRAVTAIAATAPGRGQTRGVFIGVEATPNPDSMKFLPEDTQVLPLEFGTGQMYKSLEDAKGSAVARRLLKVPGVSTVFLSNDFISINKSEDVEWMELKPLVFGAIMDCLDSGRPLVEFVGSSGSSNTEFSEEDDVVVTLIKELLETRIRPAVQEDGGDIFFVDFEDGVVRVQLAGSCEGCPSSTQTLKHGVEAMLQHYIPEVERVEPVLDEVQQVNEDVFSSLEERLAAAGVPQS